MEIEIITDKKQMNTTNNTDILNLEIGAPIRTVTITDVTKNEITMPDNRVSDKISFTIEDNNGREFKISDVWVEDHKANAKIQGLWFTLSSDNQISPGSSLAKLMNHYAIQKLQDFIGIEVKVYPDQKNFLVLVACDETKLDENAGYNE